MSCVSQASRSSFSQYSWVHMNQQGSLIPHWKQLCFARAALVHAEDMAVVSVDNFLLMPKIPPFVFIVKSFGYTHSMRLFWIHREGQRQAQQPVRLILHNSRSGVRSRLFR